MRSLCFPLRISLEQFSFPQSTLWYHWNGLGIKTLPAVPQMKSQSSAQQLRLVCTQEGTRCCLWDPDLFGELNENVTSWFKYVLRAFSHTLDILNPECIFTASELKMESFPPSAPTSRAKKPWLPWHKRTLGEQGSVKCAGKEMSPKVKRQHMLHITERNVVHSSMLHCTQSLCQESHISNLSY